MAGDSEVVPTWARLGVLSVATVIDFRGTSNVILKVCVFAQLRFASGQRLFVPTLLALGLSSSTRDSHRTPGWLIAMQTVLDHNVVQVALQRRAEATESRIYSHEHRLPGSVEPTLRATLG